MQYIESKLKYRKLAEDGSCKDVCESYLVAAETFTEAEAVVTARMQPRIKGEFSVEAVKKSKVGEVMPDPAADKYWLVKWFTTAYKDDGSEKRANQLTLVQADSLEHAVKAFSQKMRSAAADYSLAAVQETPILEILQN